MNPSVLFNLLHSIADEHTFKKLAADEMKREIERRAQIKFNPNDLQDLDLTVKQGRSDGSSADYYVLPEGATQLQDLISYRNMNAQDGEMFRALYRKGLVSHSDELRDAKKILFYAQAEVARLEALRG